MVDRPLGVEREIIATSLQMAAGAGEGEETVGSDDGGCNDCTRRQQLTVLAGCTEEGVGINVSLGSAA